MPTDRCSRFGLAPVKSRKSMIRTLYVRTKSASWCPAMPTRLKEQPMIRPARCVRSPLAGQRPRLRFGRRIADDRSAWRPAAEQQSLARGGTLLAPDILNEGRHKTRDIFDRRSRTGPASRRKSRVLAVHRCESRGSFIRPLTRRIATPANARGSIRKRHRRPHGRHRLRRLPAVLFDYQCANCKTIPKNPLLLSKTLSQIRRVSMKLLRD
jgi:hypothetical protein